MKTLIRRKWSVVIAIMLCVMAMYALAEYTNTMTGGSLYIKQKAEIVIVANLESLYADTVTIGFTVKMVSTNGAQTVTITTARTKAGTLIALLGGDAAATNTYNAIRTALIQNLTP